MYQCLTKKGTLILRSAPLGRVSKDELGMRPSFETRARGALLRMRSGALVEVSC